LQPTIPILHDLRQLETGCYTTSISLCKLATDAKRKIAESIIEKLVIGDGEIDIALSHLPSSEQLTKTQQQLRGSG